MKSVPTNDFAVVEDTERKMIVSAGNYGAMVEEAKNLNQAYQSKAYVARLFQN